MKSPATDYTVCILCGRTPTPFFALYVTPAGTMMPYGTCQLHPGPYTPAELETIERRLAERAERRASEHAHSE
jgi:hypothetical protein